MTTRAPDKSLTDHARATLRARHQDLVGRYQKVEGAARALVDEREPDWEDRASLLEAADNLTLVAEKERAQLALVTAALERLERGTWGRCTACGEPIDAGRLRVMPEAPRCGRCTERG
jgi:RNA polymerase-binding transcription factor DksA